jgi:hypothetical protein
MPQVPTVVPATLHAWFDPLARGRGTRGDPVILRRLAAGRALLATSRHDADAAGWTALQFERDGGMGRLRLVGIAPGAECRSVVPDAATFTVGGD